MGAAGARPAEAELVEINTTHSMGSTVVAAEAMAKHMRAAGFPAEDVVVVENAPRKGNLVVRYRGRNTGRKPILLLSHIDVVEADPEGLDAAAVRVHRAGRHLLRPWRGRRQGRGGDPPHDPAAHEGRGLRARPRHHRGAHGRRGGRLGERRRVDAGEPAGAAPGGVRAQRGRRRARGRTGATSPTTCRRARRRWPTSRSRPPTPAVTARCRVRTTRSTTLSAALAEGGRRTSSRCGSTRSRARTSRGRPTSWAARWARRCARSWPIERDAAAAATLARDPAHNSRLRTTCVATMLEGGHAMNALPQRATATVNCRILPDGTTEDVQRQLAGGDRRHPAVTVTASRRAADSPPSPLTPGAAAHDRGDDTNEVWPGMPVVPTMSTGATDGRLPAGGGDPGVRRVRALLRERERARHERAHRGRRRSTRGSTSCTAS